MQGVSGPIGKEKVHFEAPPAHRIDDEVEQFLDWFTSSEKNTGGLVRAATAHLILVKNSGGGRSTSYILVGPDAS